jgi:hypothetical protein
VMHKSGSDATTYLRQTLGRARRWHRYCRHPAGGEPKQAPAARSKPEELPVESSVRSPWPVVIRRYPSGTMTLHVIYRENLSV